MGVGLRLGPGPGLQVGSPWLWPPLRVGSQPGLALGLVPRLEPPLGPAPRLHVGCFALGQGLGPWLGPPLGVGPRLESALGFVLRLV